MSEVNYPLTTVPHLFTNTLWLAQTFSPRESHNLLHATAQVQIQNKWQRIDAFIQYLNPAGFPDGINIDSSMIYWGNIYACFNPKTIFFTFSGIRLVKGIKYAFILRTPSNGTPPTANAEFEIPPGHYPRGKLLVSFNAGVTWQPSDEGDLHFAEWGDPPLALAWPTMPLDKWTILTIAFTHWDIGLTIRCSTNVPCRPVLYYSSIKPKKQNMYRLVRGTSTLWKTMWRFAGFKSVEQTEYTDQIYHTYEIPDWPPGATKWLTFKAKVGLTKLLSVGPIFEHTHPGGTPRTFYLRPNAPGDYCNINNGHGEVCPDHWMNVDDIVSDEDYTTVYNLGQSGYRYDLYHIQPPPPDVTLITSISLHHRIRRISGYGYAVYFKQGIKTHGTEYWTTFNQIPSEWTNYRVDYVNNPFTNLPWTPAELASLQIGIGSHFWLGVGISGYSTCTQTYISAERGAAGGPD